jgi:hypothetical protein
MLMNWFPINVQDLCVLVCQTNETVYNYSEANLTSSIFLPYQNHSSERSFNYQPQTHRIILFQNRICHIDAFSRLQNNLGINPSIVPLASMYYMNAFSMLQHNFGKHSSSLHETIF